jgi:hypothetical protein
MLDEILSGRKTIESRLSSSRRTPFGQVRAGERVYFKVSGGAYGATALISHVETFENLKPTDIAAIRRLHNANIRGSAEYWKQKRSSRVATLMWIHKIEATEMGPILDDVPNWQPCSAWGVLSETLDLYPPMAA